MNDVKVEVEIIEIPQSFFGNDYLNDELFRQEIKNWLNQIWVKKDKILTSPKKKLKYLICKPNI